MMYEMSNGEKEEEVRMLREKKPGHILFLCVANSARSQMAEAIARHYAPPDVKISSAGSQPTRIRAEAREVLKEVGISCDGQSSKGLDAIEAETVEAVITLCAEEVCPVFPGDVIRVHWGLPDPAAEGNAETRMIAFRNVRDELVRRIARMF